MPLDDNVTELYNSASTIPDMHYVIASATTGAIDFTCLPSRAELLMLAPKKMKGKKRRRRLAKWQALHC